MSNKDSTNKLLEIDLSSVVLEPLQEHVRKRVDEAARKVLLRYCGVCFFGNPEGELFGIPICKECREKLFHDSESLTGEKAKFLQDFAILSRDSHEALWIEMKNKNNILDAKNVEHVLKAYQYYLKSTTLCGADERTAKFIIDRWATDYDLIEGTIPSTRNTYV